MNKTTFGDRMKRYEIVSQNVLARRTPVIIRIDGKAFHTWTQGLAKPFDYNMTELMTAVTLYLVRNIQGCKLGYYQSDEISLLLTDWETHETDAWFDNNVQKLVSVAASSATAIFAKMVKTYLPDKGELAMFDARAFNLPKEEVNNYFIWRQQDTRRNYIQACGQFYIGHKKIQGLNTTEIVDLILKDQGIDILAPIEQDRFSESFKNGITITRKNDQINSTHIFKDNPEFINRAVEVATE